MDFHIVFGQIVEGKMSELQNICYYILNAGQKGIASSQVVVFIIL